MIFVATSLSLVTAFLLTPWVRRLALARGAVERPDARKRHAESTPSVGGLAVMGLFLAMVIVGEHLTLDPDDPRSRWARLGLNLMTYGAALTLYAVIYATRTRGLLSATAVLLASIPLALELLRGTVGQMGRTWLYALVVGLIMGEATWVLNYWVIGTLTGGALLLLTFYLAAGLAQQHLLGRLTRRVLLEFVLTALVGMGLILGFTPWLR